MKQLSKDLYNEAIKRLWDFRIKRNIEPTTGNKVERIFTQDAQGLWKVRLIKTIQQVTPVDGGIPKNVTFYYSLL